MDTKPLCSIDDCNNHARARGWCVKHYNRWKRYNNPHAKTVADAGEPYRYLTDVVLTYEADECLMWPYGRFKSGYGCVNINGRALGVHRLACKHRNGPPTGLKNQAAHICGNRGCCNPRHVRWATTKENSDDRELHGTALRGEVHPSARLSVADVLAIRALAGSFTQLELAERFCVKRAAIGHIINGTRWKSVLQQFQPIHEQP